MDVLCIYGCLYVCMYVVQTFASGLRLKNSREREYVSGSWYACFYMCVYWSMYVCVSKIINNNNNNKFIKQFFFFLNDAPGTKPFPFMETGESGSIEEVNDDMISFLFRSYFLAGVSYRYDEAKALSTTTLCIYVCMREQVNRGRGGFVVPYIPYSDAIYLLW